MIKPILVHIGKDISKQKWIAFTQTEPFIYLEENTKDELNIKLDSALKLYKDYKKGDYLTSLFNYETFVFILENK